MTRWPKFEDYGDEPDPDNPWLYLFFMLLGVAILALLAWAGGEWATHP